MPLPPDRRSRRPHSPKGSLRGRAPHKAPVVLRRARQRSLSLLSPALLRALLKTWCMSAPDCALDPPAGSADPGGSPVKPLLSVKSLAPSPVLSDLLPRSPLLLL